MLTINGKGLKKTQFYKRYFRHKIGQKSGNPLPPMMQQEKKLIPMTHLAGSLPKWMHLAGSLILMMQTVTSQR